MKMKNKISYLLLWIEYTFNLKFGWFFVNGKKTDRYNSQLEFQKNLLSEKRKIIEK